MQRVAELHAIDAVGTARLLRDSFPGQHEHIMLQLDGIPELQFLYLQAATRTPNPNPSPTPNPVPNSNPTPSPTLSLTLALTLTLALYLQGVLQQAQRYATPVAAGSDSLPLAEQIEQAGLGLGLGLGLALTQP